MQYPSLWDNGNDNLCIFSFGSCTGLSPYDKNYKGCLRAEQRELIFEHQRVSKMTRRDLEDQYIKLCDEHYATKRENRFNQEKIKRLITKISRISSCSLSDLRASLNPKLIHRARETLSFEEKLQICIFDLEVQNSQLNEKLQAICKRHGLPMPHYERPASEMCSYYVPQENTNRLRTRARSCNHINGGAVKDSVDDEHVDDHVVTLSPKEQVEEGPVKDILDNSVLVKELQEKNERLAKLLSDFNDQLEKEKSVNNELSYKLKELEIRKHISENIELINLKEALEQSKSQYKQRIEMLENVKGRQEKNLIEERVVIGK